MAIVSLVCGLLFFLFPVAIVAIITGHLSLSEIRKSAGRLKGEGAAIAGLVLGYLGIVAIPFILIIAAIAIPNLLRARIAANESSAVASVRALNSAETSFMLDHVDKGYTCELSDLADDHLIEPPLASGQKNGYVFRLQGCEANEIGTLNRPIMKYRVIAYPVTRNTTGVRTFCSDESGAIKADNSNDEQDCFLNGSPLE
jgi:type IV pilus assembly protein PilA